MTLHGQIFEAGTARAQDAELRLSEGHLTLTCQDDTAGQEVALKKISDRLAGTARRLQLLDGRLFVTSDDDGADALAASLGRPAGSRLFRFELFRKQVVGFGLGLFLLTAGFLYYGLPVVTDFVADLVPDPWERQIGDASFESLDDLVMEPSQLDPAKQEHLRELFNQVVAVSNLTTTPEFHLRASSMLGANAFAFPGGPVVMTDDLIKLAPSDAALVGVLAHEVAHIESRHGLRRLMRAAGWTIIITTVFGDAGTLVDELTAFPVVLVTQGYSRSFETDADRRALILMRNLELDPKDFAAMLTRLRDLCGEACDSGGWWASHPGFQDRIEVLQGVN